MNTQITKKLYAICLLAALSLCNSLHPVGDEVDTIIMPAGMSEEMAGAFAGELMTEEEVNTLANALFENVKLPDITYLKDSGCFRLRDGAIKTLADIREEMIAANRIKNGDRDLIEKAKKVHYNASEREIRMRYDMQSYKMQLLTYKASLEERLKENANKPANKGKRIRRINSLFE